MVALSFLYKGLLLAAALATLSYSVYRDSKTNQIQTVLRLHEKWTGREYARCRAEAQEIFLNVWARSAQENQNDVGQEKNFLPKISAIYGLDRNHSFGLIEHFLDDLGSLAAAKQIDKKLSASLLLNVVNYWFCVFKHIDWDSEDQLSWWHDRLEPNLSALYHFWDIRPEDQSHNLLNQVRAEIVGRNHA